MSSPVPLLLAVLIGGAMMAMGTKTKLNPVEDEEIPSSLDYEDPELAQALEDADDAE